MTYGRVLYDYKKEEALRSLREADRAWCESASDLDEVMSFLAEDIIWYYCRKEPMRSRDEVREWLTEAYKDPLYSITWTPEEVFVGESGDLGYTRGTWKYEGTDFTEEKKEKIHYYSTIWRKQSNGEWKVAIETDY